MKLLKIILLFIGIVILLHLINDLKIIPGSSVDFFAGYAGGYLVCNYLNKIK